MISEASQAFRASQKGPEGETYPEVGKLTYYFKGEERAPAATRRQGGRRGGADERAKVRTSHKNGGNQNLEPLLNRHPVNPRAYGLWTAASAEGSSRPQPRPPVAL